MTYIPKFKNTVDHVMVLQKANKKPGSQYDAGASVKSAEHNQRRIVNEFYVGTLGALVRATATQGIDSISIRALASVTFC